MNDKDIRWQQRFSNYRKALNQLVEAVQLSEQRELTDLEKQGLVQAFEYTHELAWKTLKDFLREQGYGDLYGSRDVTRQAFSLGLLDDGDIWMEMIKSRNQTSHTYNEASVLEIVKAIVDKYCHAFIVLRETLDKKTG